MPKGSAFTTASLTIAFSTIYLSSTGDTIKTTAYLARPQESISFTGPDCSDSQAAFLRLPLVTPTLSVEMLSAVRPTLRRMTNYPLVPWRPFLGTHFLASLFVLLTRNLQVLLMYSLTFPSLN